MSIQHTPLQSTATPARKSRRKRLTGTAAGLLFFALLAGIALGALWGFFRPAYIGDVTDGFFIANEAESPRNVEFTSFISFVIITGVLGIVISMVAYMKVGRVTGVGALLWVGFVAFAAAFTFYFIGNVVTGFAHPMPDLHASDDQPNVELVPVMTPGVGWFAAPFLATLTYWILAIISLPDPEPEAVPGRMIGA